MNRKIMIFGAGYVGSSLAVLFSQQNEVILIDLDKEKVRKINKKQSPIFDPKMSEYLSSNELRLSASNDFRANLDSVDYVILALPTNYDEVTNFFDTSIIEGVLKDLSEISFRNPVIIKSTIPIGFTRKLESTFPNMNVIFAPEFLREGHAIEDNLHPSRIVIGNKSKTGGDVADLFKSISFNDPTIFLMDSTEAEAVKLFANSYLANRVSFFNELDSFSLIKGLDSKSIIDGISSDPRIGSGYNNPSFGYGGYCLPKDTKQLLANYSGITQRMFSAAIESNYLRKQFIAERILEKNPKIVGIYRLVMKEGSDNFRESAIFDVMNIISSQGIDIIIYEPLLEKSSTSFDLCSDLHEFKIKSDLIMANRFHDDLEDVSSKVFTRDIYGES